MESLKGQIEVKSTLGVGTRANVIMRLPSGESANAKSSQLLIQSPRALKDKTASIVLPFDSLGGGGERLNESIRLACAGFNMKVDESFDLTSSQPDFLITEPASLDFILPAQAQSRPQMPPLAVICLCTDLVEKTAVEARINRQFAALGWVGEVVPQP